MVEWLRNRHGNWMELGDVGRCQVGYESLGKIRRAFLGSQNMQRNTACSRAERPSPRAGGHVLSGM